MPRRCGAPQCSSAPVLHHGGLMFILRLGLHAAAAPRLLPARLEDAAAGHLHAQLPPLNFLVVRCWWHFSIPMPILPAQCANVFVMVQVHPRVPTLVGVSRTDCRGRGHCETCRQEQQSRGADRNLHSFAGLCFCPTMQKENRQREEISPQIVNVGWLIFKCSSWGSVAYIGRKLSNLHYYYY